MDLRWRPADGTILSAVSIRSRRASLDITPVVRTLSIRIFLAPFQILILLLDSSVSQRSRAQPRIP
jgi:hypothetical protein